MSKKIPFNKHAYLDTVNNNANGNLVCHYDKNAGLDTFVGTWLIHRHLKRYDAKRFYGVSRDEPLQRLPGGYVVLVNVIYDLSVMRKLIEASRYLLIVSNVESDRSTLNQLRGEYRSEQLVVFHNPGKSIVKLITDNITTGDDAKVVSLFKDTWTDFERSFFELGLASRGYNFTQLDRIEKEVDFRGVIMEGVKYNKEKDQEWRRIKLSLVESLCYMNLAGNVVAFLPRENQRHQQWIANQLVGEVDNDIVGLAYANGDDTRLFLYSIHKDCNVGAIARSFGGRGDQSAGEFVLEGIALEHLV